MLSQSVDEHVLQSVYCLYQLSSTTAGTSNLPVFVILVNNKILQQLHTHTGTRSICFHSCLYQKYAFILEFCFH